MHTYILSHPSAGAWAWGDRLFWGYDDSQQASAQEAFNTAVDQGVNLFDTAEVCGFFVSAGRYQQPWAFALKTSNACIYLHTNI
jgi:aryl-alcohol dehydrogenase-like predicted oxidoreductase